MDGVSSAAAVVGLVQLGAQVVTSLYRYASSVKTAESSCKGLIYQIGLITIAETAIESVVKNTPLSRPPELQALISEWLKEDGPPAKCKRELEELLAWLQNQAEGKKHKGMGRIVWPFKEKKIEATIEMFERSMPYFRDVLAIDTSKLLQSAAEDKKKNDQEKEKSKILKWLDGFDCTDKHAFVRRQRQDTTCEWLFRDNTYVEWRESRMDFLWLHGNPGTGKSVLASVVINDISLEEDHKPLAYFYCDFRDYRCTSTMEILRSLTKQLLRSSQSNWLSSFPDLASRRQQGDRPPADLGILSDLLRRAASLHEHPIIIIDALDECEDLPRLLEELARLREGRCRVLVTSRTLQPIKEAFVDLPSIHLADQVDQIRDDILLHIQTEMQSRSKLLTLDPVLKDHILDALMEKASGMFRWVQCQLDRLNDCVTERNVYEVLETLPETLYDTYAVMLRAIDKKRF